MAGRPLKGTPWQRGSSWVVTLPPQRGSRRRVDTTFRGRRDAERWSAAAIAALMADQPLPDPAPFRLVVTTRRRVATSFADVANDWFAEHYEGNRPDVPSPKRCESVRQRLDKHVIPFFAARTDHVKDVSRDMVRDWLDAMAGEVVAEAPDESLPVGHFTIAQVAKMTGLSVPTIRRHVHDGSFPGAYRSLAGRGPQGTWYIPADDVAASGLSAGRPKGSTSSALSTSTAGECLYFLRGILDHARSQQLMDHDPTLGLKVRTPVRGAKRHTKPQLNEPCLFTVSECASVADLLHLNHRLVFWLMRGAGLRVSEAFGLRLCDLTMSEGHYVANVHRQSGKVSKARTDEGVVKVTALERTKTTASVRRLPLSKPLTEFISLYIEAVHADSALTAPLVRTKGGAGYSAFLQALKSAYRQCGLGYEDVGFKAATHHLRKCFATDVGFSNMPEPLRSRYLGHNLRGFGGGAEVTARVYTLQVPAVSALLPIADAHGALIEAEVGSLLRPADLSTLLPRKLFKNDDEVHAAASRVLEEAGLLVDLVKDGHELVSVAEAAELLDLTPGRVRALVAEKALVGVATAVGARQPRTMVTLDSIDAHRNTPRTPVDPQTRRPTPDALQTQEVCALLGVNWQQLQRLVKRLGIESTTLDGTPGVFFTAEEAKRLAAQHAAELAMRDAVASLTEVSTELRVTLRTAGKLARLGALEVDDAATKLFGRTMVTRESLAAEAARRTRRKKREPSSVPEGFIPIEEAMVRLGKTRLEVLALSHEGVRVHRSKDYRFYACLADIKCIKAAAKQKGE